MTKVDMHIHSKYSDHPSEWFLQRLGTSESYTEPEYIYKTAKESGMDFVTITDHNKIDASLLLKEKYPQEVFPGVESTAYFPEDGCKVHILIYGLDEKQFNEIQNIRKSIYDLRDYLKEKGLTHSVAHATYSVNGKISIEHLEKLILLFDIFEGINGNRNKVNNETLVEVLSSLTPGRIQDLYGKYRIEPFSDTPWIKGLIGGSDDHAGLFIGQSFTQTKGRNIQEFLDLVKRKESYPKGRHSNYKSLAFMFYKIGYDFSKYRKEAMSSAFLDQLTELVFEKNDLGIKDWILLKRLKSLSKKNGSRIYLLLSELVESIKANKRLPMENRLNVAYQKVAEIADEFFKILLKSLERDIKNGDIINIIKNLSASIPGIFLSIPFFSTIKLMSESRNLLSDLKARFRNGRIEKEKRILWFTDTLSDLNGVSVTLRKIGNLAYERNLNLNIVSSFQPEKAKINLPQSTINLPSIYSFRLPGYERYTLRVPSVLKSLEQIYQYNPDEIIISTPGPIGLVGLLASKLLNIKSTGIYHTDFTLQAHKIIKDESVAKVLENFIKSFYSSMDEVRVPTREYIHILENRGFGLFKMKIFRRGIDTQLFTPKPEGRAYIQKKFNIKDGFNLLYVGRISQDKELDFLIEVYKRLLERVEGLNLLIVGDGPYLKELRSKTKKYERIIFTGQIEYESLARIYSWADLFVFPSMTDTFGMVVLEAQSCGLPAVVSDRGGPKEIIQNHKTGLIAEAGSLSDWMKKISFMRDLIENYPVRYSRMKEEARRNVLRNYSWERALKDLIRDKKTKKYELSTKSTSLLYAGHINN